MLLFCIRSHKSHDKNRRHKKKTLTLKKISRQEIPNNVCVSSGDLWSLESSHLFDYPRGLSSNSGFEAVADICWQCLVISLHVLSCVEIQLPHCAESAWLNMLASFSKRWTFQLTVSMLPMPPMRVTHGLRTLPWTNKTTNLWQLNLICQSREYADSNKTKKK